MNTVLESIKKLEADEHEAVRLLSSKIDHGYYSSFANDPIQMVRYFQTFNKNGENYLFDKNVDGRWANACDKVPILRQLLLEPNLIVDLKPVANEAECLAEYGVNSSQLFKLGELGFLIFNIYAYESTRSSDFAPYLSSTCEGIKNILQSDKCRINSIRKEVFFQKMLPKSISYQDLTADYRDKTFWLLDNISEDRINVLIKKGLIRPGQKEGIAETIAQQMAYNFSVMSSESSSIDQSRYQTIKGVYDDISLNFMDLNQVEFTFSKVRGLKNCIATPYSASMGGVYNMSAGAVGSLYSIMKNYPGKDVRLKEGKTKQNVPQIKAIYEFIEATSQRFNEQREEPLDDRVFNEGLTNREFDNYVELIRSLKPMTSKLNKAVHDLTDSNTTTEANFIVRGGKYFDVEAEIRKELKVYNRSKNVAANALDKSARIIISAIPVALSGLSSAVLGIIAFGSAVIGGTVKDEVKNLPVDKLINKDRRRILANLEDIRRLSEG